MGDEVVLARYDLTVPGHVGEDGVVRLDARECRFDRLQDDFLIRFSSARLRTFWKGNSPWSERSSLAISRTSLATAGSLRMGGG